MDTRLTQRLVGAAVIAALAVIFVPELLERQPRETPPRAPEPTATQPRRTGDTPAMTFSQPKPATAPTSDQTPTAPATPVAIAPVQPAPV